MGFLHLDFVSNTSERSISFLFLSALDVTIEIQARSISLLCSSIQCHCLRPDRSEVELHKSECFTFDRTRSNEVMSE